jgi:flagellar biosynthetic protein FlhB
MASETNTDRLSERPYPPSPLRLEEAKRQGRSARSADLTAALAGLAGLLAVAWLGERLIGQLTAAMRRLLDAGASPLSPLGASAGAAAQAAWPLAGTAGLIALAVLAVAVGIGLAQGGWRVAFHSVRLDWGRINPAAGLGRALSRRAWVRMGFSFAKMAAVVLLAASAIAQSMAQICNSAALDAARLLGLAGGLAYGLGLRIMAALVLLAAADYLYQRWEHHQDLKMTRREFLEDLKRMEGDPLTRRRRRRLAASRAAGAPARLARASIVVAGPGGRVVALQCYPGMRASRVVARAAGRSGGELLEAARNSDIPVLANSQLAEVLFARCSVGTVAPRTAHRAVAEFLATAARGAQHRGKAAPESS